MCITITIVHHCPGSALEQLLRVESHAASVAGELLMARMHDACVGPDSSSHCVAAVADEWEDWDDDSFEPKLQAGAAANGQKFETKGQAVLASVREPDQSKFEGEDEEDAAPPAAWDKTVPQPQQAGCPRRHLHTRACM